MLRGHYYVIIPRSLSRDNALFRLFHETNTIVVYVGHYREIYCPWKVIFPSPLTGHYQRFRQYDCPVESQFTMIIPSI